MWLSEKLEGYDTYNSKDSTTHLVLNNLQTSEYVGQLLSIQRNTKTFSLNTLNDDLQPVQKTTGKQQVRDVTRHNYTDILYLSTLPVEADSLPPLSLVLLEVAAC